MSGDYLGARLAAVQPEHLVVACRALINRARLLYQEMRAGSEKPDTRRTFSEVVEALLNISSVVEATPQVSPAVVKELRAGVERVLEAAKELATDQVRPTLFLLFFCLRE